MPNHIITIPTTSTAGDSKPYTVYHIHIRPANNHNNSSNGPARTVLKRYSDFAALHQALRAEAGGAAPPAPLPPKTGTGLLRIFGFGGGGGITPVGDPALIEARRQGLQTYLRAIEEADDPRWRGSRAYQDFLGIGEAAANGRGGKEEEDDVAAREYATGSGWLDGHAALRALLQEARVQLARREQAVAPAAVHEAGVGAKKALVRAEQLGRALERGLAALAEGGAAAAAAGGGERLGEGELRRRRDLLGRARKEREGLEGVLGAGVASRVAAAASGGASGRTSPSASVSLGSAGQGNGAAEKDGLFRGAKPGAGGGGGRRVLGAPLPETRRTRELDNDGVLQLQRQIMAEQDEDLVDLAKVARRMRELGVQINEEVVLQNQMLGLMEEDVERVDNKIKIARKRADKIR